MSTQHVSTPDRGLRLSVLAITAGIGLWTIVGAVSDLQGTLDPFASTASQCQNTADVLAALDRSRNGISLTCNSDTLLGSVVR